VRECSTSLSVIGERLVGERLVGGL
jgi:hypothetical protein